MITSVADTIKLNSGIEMPGFGLGCFKALGDEIYNAVRWAVDAGYRMVDTATFYDNEKDVGRGVRECGVSREEVFVVSKMWPTSYDNPQKGLELSLKELDTEYMDLYLLHWPGTNETLRYKAWETLLEYREKGRIRAAGVSNFTVEHLEGLIREFGDALAVNQVELHPWNPQRELSAYCREQGIAVTAWGPISRGHIAEVPLMDELGKKYGKSPVQITLRWHLQKENVIIPKSSNKGRIQANSQIFDFSLNDEDMARIDSLESGRHFGFDPNTFAGKTARGFKKTVKHSRY